MQEWIGILIALAATAVSLLSYWSNNKREKEKYVPILIIDHVSDFEDSYDIILKNIKDNYFVIKEICSTNDNLKVKYDGVAEIETYLKKDLLRSYKGHCIEMKVKADKHFEAQIIIKVVDFSGKLFTVQTPVMEFVNGKKVTNIEGQYLEFV